MAATTIESSVPSPLEALRARRETSMPAIVRNEVSRMIEAGELLPGAWVNEADLAACLGVSRGVVREACRGLEQHGLLEFVVNRGAFVRTVGPAEAAELYEIRAALFAVAGRRLAGSLTQEGDEQLATLVARMDSAAHQGAIDLYYPLNLQFHLAIFALAGSKRLLASYESCVRELHLFRRGGLVTPERMVQSNAEHTAILQALRAHDPLTAAARMEAHVLEAKARILDAAPSDPFS